MKGLGRRMVEVVFGSALIGIVFIQVMDIKLPLNQTAQSIAATNSPSIPVMPLQSNRDYDRQKNEVDDVTEYLGETERESCRQFTTGLDREEYRGAVCVSD